MPDSMTPSDTTASAAICRNAPRTLRSDLLPDMKSSAVNPVDQNSDSRDPGHDARMNRLRGAQAIERFQPDGAHRDEQKNRICERRENRRALQAVGITASGGTFGQDRGDPCQHEAKHVAEIVAGIRKQGQ